MLGREPQSVTAAAKFDELRSASGRLSTKLNCYTFFAYLGYHVFFLVSTSEQRGIRLLNSPTDDYFGFFCMLCGYDPTI
jgi:hypothetical protein